MCMRANKTTEQSYCCCFFFVIFFVCFIWMRWQREKKNEREFQAQRIQFVRICWKQQTNENMRNVRLKKWSSSSSKKATEHATKIWNTFSMCMGELEWKFNWIEHEKIMNKKRETKRSKRRDRDKIQTNEWFVVVHLYEMIEQSALKEMKTIATIAASTSTNAAPTNGFLFFQQFNTLDNASMHFILFSKHFWEKKTFGIHTDTRIERLNWNECISTHHVKSIYSFYLFSTTIGKKSDEEENFVSILVLISHILCAFVCSENTLLFHIFWSFTQFYISIFHMYF